MDETAAPDEEAPGPPGLRRFAPRSFRSSIVASTVGFMALAMIVVVLGTHLVLEYAAKRDIQQVLQERSAVMVAQLEEVPGPLRLTADDLQPGMVVYDASGERVAGSVESDVREVAEQLATTQFAPAGEGRRARGPPPGHPLRDRGSGSPASSS